MISKLNCFKSSPTERTPRSVRAIKHPHDPGSGDLEKWTFQRDKIINILYNVTAKSCLNVADEILRNGDGFRDELKVLLMTYHRANISGT